MKIIEVGIRKKLRDDLKRFGLHARITSAYDPKYYVFTPGRYSLQGKGKIKQSDLNIFTMTFDNQEDLNYYKLVGNYKENFDLKFKLKR